MTIRITGMNSGLDTEALITELMSAYQAKGDKYKKEQTKLSWKQDAWKALNIKIKNLYTSAGNLRLSSGYTTKKAVASDASKVTVTASNNAVNTTQTLKISSVAQSAYMTGAKLENAASSSTTLSELGFSGSGTYKITGKDGEKEITVTGDTTISDFVSQINDSGAGVKASYDAGSKRIFISSKETGADADFTLTAVDSDGAKALNALGVNIEKQASSDEVKGWMEYYDSSTGKVDTDALVSDLNAVAAAKKKYAEAYQGKIAAENTIAELQNDNDYQFAAAQKSFVDGTITNADDRETLTALANMDEATLQSTFYSQDSDGKWVEDSTGTTSGADLLKNLAGQYGLAASDGSVDVSSDQMQAVRDYDTIAEKVQSQEALIDAQEALLNGADGTGGYNQDIADANSVMSQYETIDSDYIVPDMAGNLDADSDIVKEYAAKIQQFADTYTVNDDGEYVTKYGSTGAIKIDGSDAVIELNGVEYTSSTNQFSVNGLTIQTQAVTTDDITITTSTDAQGIYDKIKDFLSDYNDLMEEMSTLYNADSASGYEPLTSDEKDAMSDSEVEEWEQKIKDSLLRRDDTLGSIINTMTSAMSSSFTINGKSLALSSLGIKTAGYFVTSTEERNLLHIDGDSDDDVSSGNTDKLLAMLNSDPDAVIDLFKQVTGKLYENLDKKMKSTSLSSSYTVYNDKEMAQSYSDYTKTISEWEEKMTEIEDSYYDKFAAMETALAKLQSQSSALSGLLGS